MEDLLGLICAPFACLAILVQVASEPRRPLWVRFCVITTGLSLGSLTMGAFGMMFLGEHPWMMVFLFGFAGIFLTLFTVLCGKALGGSTEAAPANFPRKKKEPGETPGDQGH